MSETIEFKSSSDSDLPDENRIIKRTVSVTQSTEEDITLKGVISEIATLQKNIDTVTARKAELETLRDKIKSELSIS